MITLLHASRRPVLTCDHCGLPWVAGATATHLRDNAKALGWVQRNRYGAVRDYCPACAASIAEREQARSRPKRRTR